MISPSCVRRPSTIHLSRWRLISSPRQSTGPEIVLLILACAVVHLSRRGVTMPLGRNAPRPPSTRHLATLSTPSVMASGPFGPTLEKITESRRWLARQCRTPSNNMDVITRPSPLSDDLDARKET